MEEGGMILLNKLTQAYYWGYWKFHETTYFEISHLVATANQVYAYNN